jgi:hypothetical protein
VKSREGNAEKLAIEKEKSIKIRERYDKNNELRRNGEVVEVVDPEFAAIDNIIIACVDEERAQASYITYLETATIARLNLPLDQKALVYSHKAARVIDFMNNNNFLSLYIPAVCTDTVAND